ncbi:MAG: DUF2630 family protein [Casimicrobiaceae bacterium]
MLGEERIIALQSPAKAGLPTFRRTSEMEHENIEGRALSHIESLVAEEHKLFGKGSLGDEESQRLKAIQVQLDRYWDLLRQRRAAAETGHDPKDAKLRPPGVVENYKG